MANAATLNHAFAHRRLFLPRDRENLKLLNPLDGRAANNAVHVDTAEPMKKNRCSYF